MKLNKNQIYLIQDTGRIYYSKTSKAWFFVYEGAFLTAAANTGHRSDRTACEAARPQTKLAPERAAEVVSNGSI